MGWGERRDRSSGALWEGVEREESPCGVGRQGKVQTWDVSRGSAWIGVMEKRTPGFGLSPVGCLTVGVAGGRQEGSGVGAAVGGAAAPGSAGSEDSVGFRGVWQTWGISWG